MVAVEVFGNDHAVAFAGSQGNFQLNVYKPVILQNVLQSIDGVLPAIRLLASLVRAFAGVSVAVFLYTFYKQT